MNQYICHGLNLRRIFGIADDYVVFHGQACRFLIGVGKPNRQLRGDIPRSLNSPNSNYQFRLPYRRPSL